MSLIEKENCLILEGGKHGNYEYPDLEASLDLLKAKDAIPFLEQITLYDMLKSDSFRERPLPEREFDEAEQIVRLNTSEILSTLDIRFDIPWRSEYKDAFLKQHTLVEWQKNILGIRRRLKEINFYQTLKQRVSQSDAVHPTSIQPYGFLGFVRDHFEAALLLGKDNCFLPNMLVFSRFLDKVYSGTFSDEKVYDGNGKEIDKKRLEDVFKSIHSVWYEKMPQTEIIDAALYTTEKESGFREVTNVLSYDHRVDEKGIVKAKITEPFLSFGPQNYFHKYFDLESWLKNPNPQGFPSTDNPSAICVNPEEQEQEKKSYKLCVYEDHAHRLGHHGGFYMYSNNIGNRSGPEIFFNEFRGGSFSKKADERGIRPVRIRQK